VSETTAAAVVLPEWLDEVAVAYGDVPPALEGATDGGVLWAAGAGRFWLEVPGVGRYLVVEGSQLTVDPVAGADPADVARLARMTPLAALLFQRGIVAWHGATAVRGGQAVVVAGDSATGKSTLLGALLARGWGMLGDELAPVTVAAGKAVMVLPTGSDVRVWPDAIERLEGQGVQLPAAGSRLVSGPVPVRSIWRLALHNEGATEIATDEGFDRFDAVGRLVYQGRVARALLDRGAYLKLAAAVASNIPHYRLRRPRGAWTVTELADMIERDFERSAPGAG
jgi:hypothetical protein